MKRNYFTIERRKPNYYAVLKNGCQIARATSRVNAEKKIKKFKATGRKSIRSILGE